MSKWVQNRYFIGLDQKLLNKTEVVYPSIHKEKKIVKKDKKIEMPDLFRILKKRKQNTVIFPMFENWLDIGDTKEYERAQKKFY